MLRCNHCDDAPCVAICPTTALFRRADGIVDLDGSRCIGCKSCLQACPYDALYIDPDTATAAKCHYCAHRVEVGLEPACVIVCPERAIIAGDLDDPQAEIAQLVAREQVQVRKPEQGTKPKVYYLGADEGVLTPQVMTSGKGYLWAERAAQNPEPVVRPGPEGKAEAWARPVYDVPHMAQPWGWKVAAYLWTKAIAAGALLLAAIFVLTAWGMAVPLFRVTAPAVALAFLAVTSTLLVWDLRRPDRFLYILFKPNPTSWLVWGAWILMAYGGLGVLWLLGGLSGADGLLRALALPTVLVAAAAAGYSAFLFGQAEGRDFWQSPVLLWDLLASAPLAGAAALLLAGWLFPNGSPVREVLAGVLAAGVLAHGCLVLAELYGPHPNLEAARAARLLTGGPYRHRFWGQVVGGGFLAPLVLLAVGGTPATLIAAVLALAGLWAYEDLWVRAGQALPLS